MEAVGLAASIITLISAATLTGATITRAWGLRGCPQSITTSLNEVEDFKGVLLLVHNVLSDLDYDNDQIRRLLDRAKIRLAAFDTYLKSEILREEAQVQDDERPKLKKRAKWKEVVGQLQHEIDTLKQELSSIKQSLMVALAAVQLQYIPKILLNVQRVSVVQIGDPSSTIATPVPNPIDTTQLIERAASSSANPDDSVQHVSFHQQPTHTGVAPGKLSQTDHTFLQIRATPASQRCRSGCPCQYHIACQGQSPQWLRGLIGTVLYNFTGAPLLNKRTCNFTLCKNGASKAGTMHIQYAFPAWMLPVAIEMTASWRCLRGIGGSWSLKVPRFIDSSHLWFRYTRCLETGTVEDILELMQTTSVRPFDIFRDDQTLLTYSLYRSSPEMIAVLIENGADLSHRSICGISLAEDFFLLTFLRPLPELANSDMLEETRESLDLSPCHQYVINNALHQLRVHLELDPSILLHRDNLGFTLLHWVVLCAEPQTVGFLLNAGADVNAVTRGGVSVLMWAVESQNSAIMCEMLVDAGANVNWLKGDGNTSALYFALSITSPNADTVKVLLRAGADVYHTNRFGHSILHQAAATASTRIFELLLLYGANLNVLSVGSVPIIAAAITGNNHDVLKLILQRSHSLERTDSISRWSALLLYAAQYGDSRTLHILTEACFTGLCIGRHGIQPYWDLFHSRSAYHVSSQKDIIEVAWTAFQALLDSISFIDDNIESIPATKTQRIPGAFVEDEERSDEYEERSGEEEDKSEEEDGYWSSHESAISDLAEQSPSDHEGHRDSPC